jgi:cell division protease FtsH
VQRLVDETFERAVSILERRRDLLEEGARLLLQKETLEDADLAEIDRKLKNARESMAAASA